MAARTELERSQALSSETLRAGSRLRLRALALLAGAMEVSGVSKVELAKRLGVRKSAVTDAVNGRGNFRLQTLAEYLSVMGFELELVPVRAGEVALAMRERRAPNVERLTARDRDWNDPAAVTVMAGRASSGRNNWVGSPSTSARETPMLTSAKSGQSVKVVSVSKRS